MVKTKTTRGSRDGYVLGLGWATKEEHADKIRRGKDWHEELRLSDLQRAKERLKDGTE